MRHTPYASARTLIRTAACLVLAAAPVSAHAARKGRAPEPSPVATIDMQPLGFRRISDRILQSGRSAVTVDFVSADRILVSFLSRGLVRRDPESTEQDHDRNVEVFVLDLPGGKQVAHATWRLHDDGQYIFPLGDGRFLTRDRNRLRLLDARLPGEEALRSHPVLDAGNGRQLASVAVTADGSMLQVQTRRGKLIGDDLDLEGDPDKKRTKSFDIRFFSIHPGPDALTLRAHATTPEEFAAPFNAEGFLSADQEDPSHFGFDLHIFVGGGKRELAGLETSCPPQASFVSATQFLISACRGGEARSMIGVLDTAGNVLWLGPDDVTPWMTFSSAPNAGRVAIRKTVANITTTDPTGLVPNSVIRPRSQAIQVRQITTGQEVLTVTGLPVQRAPQNFSLSRDGSRLAVWRDDSIAIYQLPPTK